MCKYTEEVQCIRLQYPLYLALNKQYTASFPNYRQVSGTQTILRVDLKEELNFSSDLRFAHV